MGGEKLAQGCSRSAITRPTKPDCRMPSRTWRGGGGAGRGEARRVRSPHAVPTAHAEARGGPGSPPACVVGAERHRGKGGGRATHAEGLAVRGLEQVLDEALHGAPVDKIEGRRRGSKGMEEIENRCASTMSLFRSSLSFHV